MCAENLGTLSIWKRILWHRGGERPGQAQTSEPERQRGVSLAGARARKWETRKLIRRVACCPSTDYDGDSSQPPAPTMAMFQRLAFVLAVILIGAASSAQADDAIDYLKQIKPILKERCFSCHGALKQKADLRLDTIALMREGGDNGTAILPGNAADSPLWQRVTSTEPAKRMPPLSEGEPLTAQQIALLRRWIKDGA